MTGRSRALVALYGTAGLLTAPWVIDYVVRRLCHTPWRPPAAPNIRLGTRNTTRRSTT